MSDKNKKLNISNGGFTLVEVLVAVAILAIALAPILTSFVGTARLNSTSRRKLTATTIAESLMESVKSYSLYDVAKQCTQFSGGFSLLAADLESGTNGAGGAAELTYDGATIALATVSDFSVAADGTFTTDVNGKYAFMITDIPMAGGKYDAIILYDMDVVRSNEVFVDAEGNIISVNTTLESLMIRPIRYYDVTIKVYKASSSATSSGKIAEHISESPLVQITGSKADYY